MTQQLLSYIHGGQNTEDPACVHAGRDDVEVRLPA